MTEINAILQRALSGHHLVQFIRGRIERPGGHLIGVPVAVGAQWVVLARMDDSIRLDGFDALRLVDLTGVQVRFRNRGFFVRGLAAKRQRATFETGYDPDSTRALLRTAQARHPLVTVEREAGPDEGSDIGRVVRFARRSCTMRTIAPSGAWSPGRIELAYDDVTRIGFASEYEDTLALVARLPAPLWR